MRTLLLLLSIIIFSAPLHAQLLEKVTVKEILPTVMGKAQAEFSSDAVLTNALFFGFEFQGVRFELDLADGKATGWLYRVYSPGLDSAAYYIGARVPLLGTQAVKLPLDTITRYFPVSPGEAQMIEPWADSDAALQGARDGGAETFLQANPDAKVPIAFVINNPVHNRYIPQGQYWFFRFAAASDTITCLVHATSGLPFRCISGNAAVITSLPKTSARVGQPYTYEVQAFGEPAPIFRLDTAPAGMSIDAGSGRIDWTPAAGQEGNQDVTIIAENTSGSDAQSYQIVVGGSASGPVVTSTPVTVAEAGKQYTYQVTTDGTPPITYALAEKPQGMVIDPGRGSVLWVPTRAQAAAHPVRISVSNSAGSGEQSFTLEVYKAPIIDAIANQRTGPNIPFWYQPSVDARPAPAFSLNAAPAGLAIDPQNGFMTWTPTDAQLGMHTVLFEADNGFGTAQQSFQIEVDATVDVDPVRPAGVTVLPHYPQPARSSLAIPVTVGTATVVTLDVYDALGRQVESRREATYPGTHLTFTVSTAALQPGVYFYRLQDNSEYVFRSFIVAR